MSLLQYFDEELFLYPIIPNGKVSISVIPLTKLGASLMPIAGAQKNDSYLNACSDEFSKKKVFPCLLPPR